MERLPKGGLSFFVTRLLGFKPVCEKYFQVAVTFCISENHLKMFDFEHRMFTNELIQLSINIRKTIIYNTLQVLARYC